ncbi:MAG: methylmalonyl-CoA mutase [Candidatus Dadabacteria bacterium RIFCSPHIGHO2_12_FULL_53_21]|nr:MAG: methylmalonyl-CoA mutase [Candidatus Dadabacteria bacterium RIFCSPHIGHO2_12_FULL_53_21]
MGQQGSRARILIGKAGLDGHDRGVKIVARALRDAGFEVIYTGLHNTPEAIVETALQEDVDAVGLSILSGAHNYIFPEVVRLLEEKGIGGVTVFGGGIIPKEDVEYLKTKGVKALFEPGVSTDEIIDWVRENVTPKAL